MDFEKLSMHQSVGGERVLLTSSVGPPVVGGIGDCSSR